MPVNTYQIECKKDAMRQNQDGVWKLTLTLHPHDMPQQLFGDPMGQRYMMVLALIGDDERPVASRASDASAAPKKAAEKRTWSELPAVTQAALKCQDKEFWAFVGAGNEAEAIQALYHECNIKSRSELAEGSDAEKRFNDLMMRFLDWKNFGSVVRGMGAA